MKQKVALVFAAVVIVAGLAWRQMNGRLVRWDPAPAEHQTIPEVPAAELLVAKDGSYLLDGKPVTADTLNSEVANLRTAKVGVRIDVVAAPGAPYPAVAIALKAAPND